MSRPKHSPKPIAPGWRGLLVIGIVTTIIGAFASAYLTGVFTPSAAPIAKLKVTQLSVVDGMVTFDSNPRWPEQLVDVWLENDGNLQKNVVGIQLNATSVRRIACCLGCGSGPVNIDSTYIASHELTPAAPNVTIPVEQNISPEGTVRFDLALLPNPNYTDLDDLSVTIFLPDGRTLHAGDVSLSIFDLTPDDFSEEPTEGQLAPDVEKTANACWASQIATARKFFATATHLAPSMTPYANRYGAR